MPVQVIPAIAPHAREIAHVHVTSWRTTYQGIVAEATLADLDIEARTRQWEERLAHPEPQTCNFVALAENPRIVGFATGGPVRSTDLRTDAELYAIYLLKESQRQGIGKALLFTVATYLVNAGFQSLGVWVLELNPSRAFYEVLGAERIAQQLLTRDGVTLNELGYRWQSVRSLVRRLS